MSSGSSGVKTDAINNSGTANANAAGIYTPLLSSYQQMATGTDGLTPQQKADALTASGQAIGGSTAAITGQGALQEARTGNAGSYASIADAAMRGGAAQQSSNALGVQNENTQLEHQNQLIGLQGENNLFNTDTSSAQSYLKLANDAQPSFWQSLGENVLNQGLGVAGAFAGKKLG